MRWMSALFLMVSCDDGPARPDPLSDCRAEDGDPYELGGLSVSGDLLTATLSYGGGCAEHDVELCWPDGSFLESDPVQARLELWHDGHDDPCDAYLTETHELDLAPLRQAWGEAYGSGPGTIVIRVGDQSVDYTF